VPSISHAPIHVTTKHGERYGVDADSLRQAVEAFYSDPKVRMCTSAGSCRDHPGRQWLGLGAIAIRFDSGGWCPRQSAPSLFVGGLLNPH
jgi:hypothetical protein